MLLDLIASTRAVDRDLLFHVLSFADGPLLAEAERLGATTSVLALPAALATLGDSGLRLDQHWDRRMRLAGSILRSVPALLRFVPALRAQILKTAPDIVHSNGIKAHLLSALATPRRVPVVWHVHDFLSERPIARRLLALSAGRGSTAIAISEAVARDTRLALPSLHTVTILNAVDVEEFSPGAGDGPWLDTLSGMPTAPEGTLRIGLVSTYAKWKGQKVLLEAATRVRTLCRGQSLRFYLVGGPVYSTAEGQFGQEDFRTLISHLSLEGMAGLIPFQQALPPILRSLDIVVHASTRPEPFGRSIIEAMACGRPVVVAMGGGVSEIIDPDSTGLTHAPGDVQGLARALCALIESRDLRSLLASHARAAVVERFSRDRVGPALVALYRALL